MEEKENTGHKINLKQKVSQEIHRLSEMERSIESKKMHINFLSKQENLQEKKAEALYQNSLKAAYNKINHVSTHIFVPLPSCSKNNWREIDILSINKRKVW